MITLHYSPWPKLHKITSTIITPLLTMTLTLLNNKHYYYSLLLSFLFIAKLCAQTLPQKHSLSYSFSHSLITTIFFSCYLLLFLCAHIFNLPSIINRFYIHYFWHILSHLLGYYYSKSLTLLLTYCCLFYLSSTRRFYY